ncbi:MAG: dihydrolipoyl dehydrogenase [Acidimicrobiales bacterium]
MSPGSESGSSPSGSGSSGSDAFDVVVIGGGPGGYATALYGASAGLSMAVIERDKVGGTCLHRGCIPAKEFLETASVHRTVTSASEFGVDAGEPKLDFAVSQRRKQAVVDQLYKGLSGLMKGRGITTFTGTGTLGPDRQVKVTAPDGTTTQISGEHVVIASGSAPRTIPGFEVDGEIVHTSDEVLSLERLPSEVAVIGGGAIGCEFASMFCDLGSKVTILEALPSLIPGCDEDVSRLLTRAFTKRGITVLTGVQVKGHSPRAGGAGTTVELVDGKTIDVEAVVVSIGRRPYTDNLLDPGTAVVIDERGFVVTDEYQRTSEPNVWAVGDCVNTPQLAHVGFAEGIVAVKGILGETAIPVDNTRVPWCIYTHPEVAFAGLSESAAKQAGIDVVVKKDPFGGNSRARIIGEAEGLVKIIAKKDPDGRAGQILGVHMIGPWVTEQLGQGYMAVNWEATVDEIAQFLQPHPTLSESFGETALALTGRGLHVG